MRGMNTFLRDERGATSVEYALVAAILAMALIAGLVYLTQGLGAQYDTMGEKTRLTPGG
jgi:Flp pilus assembly pilin Flp